MEEIFEKKQKADVAEVFDHATGLHLASYHLERRESKMAKPPPATPHSDIDGVHQDEVRNTDVAADRGESAGSLERAKDEAVARPGYSDDAKNRDDRTG